MHLRVPVPTARSLHHYLGPLLSCLLLPGAAREEAASLTGAEVHREALP